MTEKYFGFTPDSMGKEYRIQNTEYRIQETEYRRQETEGRIQETGDRRQETGDRFNKILKYSVFDIQFLIVEIKDLKFDRIILNNVFCKFLMYWNNISYKKMNFNLYACEN